MRKSVFIFLATTLLTATLAFAQAAPAGPQGSRHMRAGHDRIFQQLNLTADQKTQFQQLMQDQRTQTQALRNNSSLTPEQRQQQIKALRDANHRKIMALLTPDQQAQLKQLRGGKNAWNGGHRARGLEALNLSQQQKDQIKPIFQSTRQQMQALRSDNSLTPEQRHQKLQEIRQNQQAQLKSILTPEQAEQLQQMRQHRGRHWQGGQSPQSAPPRGF